MYFGQKSSYDISVKHLIDTYLTGEDMASPSSLPWDAKGSGLSSGAHPTMDGSEPTQPIETYRHLRELGRELHTKELEGFQT